MTSPIGQHFESEACTVMGIGALALTVAMIAVGVFGATQFHFFQGELFPWVVIGGSVAITLLSSGVATPATAITATLGVLGLMGVLPFPSVGLGVSVTMGLALLGSTCCLSK